jgi:hypothetical protein
MGKKAVRLKREREARAVEDEKNVHRRLHDNFWGRQCNLDHIKKKRLISYTCMTER